MAGLRAALLCGACLAFVSAGTIEATAAEQHGKTAKQCNDELKANAGTLEAAGESASAFFHACWWHTSAGQKTPVEGRKPPAGGAQTPKPAAAVEPIRAPGTASEPASHVLHHVALWHERGFYGNRIARLHRAPRFENTISAPTVEATPVFGPEPPQMAPIPAPRTQPLVKMVPVTVAGIHDAVDLAVPAALMPLVRDVLNHPAVPGLTATP